MTPHKGLLDKILKLEKESQNTVQHEEKTIKRLKENNKKNTIEEIKKAINTIDLFAANRNPVPNLFIYAKHTQPIRVFDSLVSIKFLLITTQQIDAMINSEPDRAMIFLHDGDIRLTEYTEFKQRTALLIENIKTGKLDNHLYKTYDQLLYEILGKTGTLLTSLGLDPLRSNTEHLINTKIQELIDAHLRAQYQ